MDIQTLTSFFMWCSIINGGILVVWTLLTVLASDFTYRSQNKMITMTRENFNSAMYYFLGFFKIIFLFFNVVPYIVLLMLA